MLNQNLKMYTDNDTHLNNLNNNGDDQNEQRTVNVIQREQWSNKIEYMLSVIGYVVDLGSEYNNFEYKMSRSQRTFAL